MPLRSSSETQGFAASVARGAASLHMGLQPCQDLWPTLMGAHAFARQAGMGQADFRNAVRFFQIEAHEAFACLLLPTREPREDEQARTLDVPILADHAEGLAANADTAHRPSAAGAQVRLHFHRLEPAFGAPPF